MPRRPACSTTSTASCTPTGTSCGCAIRRAGSSTRTAQACFEGVFADVTERKHAELELTHTAQHDPLTGLVNRRQFTRELEQRARAAAARRRAPCCSSTSTASSSSTTATGTRRAMRCCARPAGGCRPRCARATCSRASAATSSPPTCRTATPAAPRWSRGASWPRSRSRSASARGEVYVGGSVGIAAHGRRLADGDRSDPRRRRRDVRGQAGRDAAASSSSTRACARPRRGASRSSARCTARSSSRRSSCSCSRSSTSPTGGWPASRRCCAGGAAA